MCITRLLYFKMNIPTIPTSNSIIPVLGPTVLAAVLSNARHTLARAAAVMPLLLAGIMGLPQSTSAAHGRFINISTRALVQTGEEVMIGGFIIEDGTRQVLIQARGPELANDGIANFLADPVLTVINTTDPQNPLRITVNDNWEDTQGQWISDLWGDSPPLTDGSLSSAAVLNLVPGNYTAKVEGKDGTAGVALVEVIGIDTPETHGRFINISTRALVETGEEVMIGGFIIEDGPLQVLIQARGPELANDGIANFLADPVLTLTNTTDPQNPIELLVNDNWEQDDQGELISDLWGGSPNLAADSSSAALVIDLDPGNYTAKVEGKDGTTGVALVEVYGIDDTDREALTALYSAMDGANWTRSDNWGTDLPVDQWHGVGVDEWGRITRLDLSANQLTGPLPPEIGNLVNLETLWLFGNQLTGPIPPELGNLTNLKTLLLFDNELSGPLPAEIGALASLQDLWLYNNQLSGPLPAEIGALANLQSIDLFNNQLTGPIPSEIGALANLQDLWLSVNQLTGEIPTELGALANLQSLLLDENQFSGPIPVELGNLADLEELWFSDNQLTGPIPVELGGLANLQSLLLDNNQFSGPLPVELGDLTNLQDLWLSQNSFSGSIPLSLVGAPLTTFWYDNTDLCVPADTTLHDWLAAIMRHEGTGLDCGTQTDT